MRLATTITTIAFVMFATTTMAQSRDYESRIQELEAAIDLLQDRIERLEEQQAPRRISEQEAEAVMRKKEVSDACTEELGPVPDFAPVLGTKVSTQYIAYLKQHRACMRDKGVDY